MANYRIVTRSLLILSLFIALPASANKLIPLEHFARLPAIASPKISPDGLRMASTIIVKGKPLVVIQPIPSNGKTLEEKPAALSVGGLFVWDYDWVSNDRLILTLRDSVKDTGGAFKGKLINIHRLLSIRRDAKEPVSFHMTPSFFGVWEIFKQNAKVVSAMPEDPHHALVILDDDEGRWLKPIVHKVDVNTGKRTRILGNYANVENYIGDHQGNVRIALNTGYRSTQIDIYHRTSNDTDWEKIESADYFDREFISPSAISSHDPNILIVEMPNSLEAPNKEDRLAGQPTQYAYDLSKKMITGLYKDPTWERVKTLAKKKFPEMVIKQESHSLDKSAYIVQIYSDTSPPRYFLIDLKNMGVARLGRSYPQLETIELAEMEEIEYTARDGRVIPAFLTRPVNASKDKPLPTIIYPHGGPFAQDNWGFNNYVQFFANRGYVVLQPQFRGSTGYGVEHKEAGYQEFGAAIQDDITDGVKWLIDHGISDPNRICILGGSFGGYAALMGLIRTPDLYQCAVSINGVTNLPEDYISGRAYANAAIGKYVSNQGEDLHTYSPFHAADQITDPVLLIAGTKDTVVNYRQSKTLYKKLKKLKKAPVKYVELKGAEHWRTDEAVEIKTLTEIEKFLNKHLN